MSAFKAKKGTVLGKSPLRFRLFINVLQKTRAFHRLFPRFREDRDRRRSLYAPTNGSRFSLPIVIHMFLALFRQKLIEVIRSRVQKVLDARHNICRRNVDYQLSPRAANTDNTANFYNRSRDSTTKARC